VVVTKTVILLRANLKTDHSKEIHHINLFLRQVPKSVKRNQPPKRKLKKHSKIVN